MRVTPGIFLPVLLIGCGGGKQADPVAKPPVTWKRYTTPDGSCSAEFPGEPWHEQSGLGFDTTGTGAGYKLASADFPIPWYFFGFNDESILDYYRDRLALNTKEGSGWRFGVERRIVLDGCEGREVELHDHLDPPCFRWRWRMFVRQGRAYMAAVLIGFNQTEADAQRFLDSFRFETPKAKP